MSVKDQINPASLPLHIAIIMDGNGRWARQQGKIRVFGHQSAVKAVRETVEAAAEIGIKYLTLYAFSTENWSRPKEEVDALMELLVHTINMERPTFHKNDIRLQAIGDLNSLPEKCYRELIETIDDTAKNKRMSLILALSYSSKWEITDAVKKIAREVQQGTLKPEDVNEQTIADRLNTAGIPDPELMIRTSGEHRISNFMMWQLAYSEFYFTPRLWPDFRKEDLYEAIVNFQQRERRFGMTGDQLPKNP